MCECNFSALQKLFEEVEQAQHASRQLMESKRKLELDLHNTKKQFEAQELVRVWVDERERIVLSVHFVSYIYMYTL